MSTSIPPSSSESAPAPRRTWSRRIRDPLVAQLTQGITPEKLALTVAVGSAFALFPILGTTTLLCFLVGVLLRLNQPIIQLINQALWPVHIPVIYLCIRFGARLFNDASVHLSLREMKALLWHQPTLFFEKFGGVALHAIVAWSLLAPVYIVLIYLGALPLMRGIARLKAEAAVKAALPNQHPVP
ncbi:MAG TPA: DUF2062 domain-containing protein [Opitutus sp.]|nr:DUF2062 domain-containing protein [Opitutus sp.]